MVAEGFQCLPLEVVELVLSHVPLTCLLSTCCLVSRAWRDIIYNPLYLPWAKRYYAYKLRRQGAECGGVPPPFIVQAYLDHFFKEGGQLSVQRHHNPLFLPWANEQKSKEAKLDRTTVTSVFPCNGPRQHQT